MDLAYAVDADIARASTLPAAFYRDDDAFEAVRERVFARTWQWLGSLADVTAPGSLAPRDLAPGFLDEPLLLARDDGGALRCLSNVCTHRGNLLVRQACRATDIRCGYHSRRFDLAGRATFMPGYAGVAGFPGPADHLPQVPLAEWAGHAFASLDPIAPSGAFLDDLAAGLAGLPVAGAVHDPSRDRDFDVAAHWALYVENYLEGFHIPFVHPALAAAVDCASYETILHRYSNVQVAPAPPGAPGFAPPRPGTPPIAARYWWVFPNLMVNAYPWGLSFNLVLPRTPDRTRVLFRSYVWDATALCTGAGADLDAVELEDEAIVEAVQRGMRSRLWRGGRYSPAHERGVHQFHRLLCELLRAPAAASTQ